MKQIVHMNNVDEREDSCVCPSFSCYSKGELAEIAVKVAAAAAAAEPEPEFEFTLVHGDYEDQLIAYDGRVGELVHFPVFNRRLSPSKGGFVDREVRNPSRRNINRLSKDELRESENIPAPAGAYCIWRPKALIWCKKSKSTGSAPKQWRLRQLFRRSNSEGEGDYVILSPKAKATAASSTAPGSPSAHEMLYVWNRTNTEARKKKTYLPYRQDIVGFFSMAKGLRKIGSPQF